MYQTSLEENQFLRFSKGQGLLIAWLKDITSAVQALDDSRGDAPSSIPHEVRERLEYYQGVCR